MISSTTDLALNPVINFTNTNKDYLINEMKKSQLTINDILLEFPQLEDSKILNVYIYGSRLYAKPVKNNYLVSNEDSDYDIILIYDFDEEPKTLQFLTNQKGKESKTNYKMDISVYSKLQFSNQIKKYKFTELIIYFLDFNQTEYYPFILRNNWKFTDLLDVNNKFNLNQLRTILSQSASMTYKCSKSMFDHKLKLNEEDVEIFKGKKTMIHCLRVYLFGIQLAKYGNIIDFHCCDKYYDDIFDDLNKYNNWQEITTVYRDIKLKLHEEFKNACPLLEEENENNKKDE
ncbi:hypothetical protein ABK040_012232 [Willaertia magna]